MKQFTQKYTALSIPRWNVPSLLNFSFSDKITDFYERSKKSEINVEGMGL